MKVKALNSFSDSVYGTRAAGAVFDLPDGVDWLRAGLVEVVVEPEVEAAPVIEPEAAPEVQAPKPSRKKKG